ncbi:N-acetylglucosamine-6-phosphate deacetylase [Microlunatus phosphovorus NM-1]|uniref:N-acetylglucosamine-6-phosphate deacetylase n=1 Tax=Microlunatus phosphovorus (strain ATCC 700054 / DSM 10555 / JCM 9379 / NBRC 101784 / NCIMB 13414 / VKM Ac-1990 / NM-1) TaxID=1032480 RepID=F5XE75_MICPN|nr:N-acetylglucosamine-6-phosphate deacetylase [Microlunatus phosphovorus]BAK37623.1 N-acetylglucosamine-6-phosphate deacetylase [Microlunatus phosphovorus NM-1]
MSEHATRIRCRQLVTAAHGVLDGAVLVIADGEVIGIESADSHPATFRVTEEIDGWVVPGFVDTHGHGGGGATYATTDPDEARRARQFHREHGTTTAIASLVTAELDMLAAQIAVLQPLVEAGEFAGIHLEGPFLSARRKGAHDPDLLRDPEPAVVMGLVERSQGAVTMVTLAPELPGGLASVRDLADAGIVVAIGHTDADDATAAAALDAGATVVTHLFNAMPSIHHREPGPIPRLLADDRCEIELIADGFHLHPQVIELAVAAAGVDRVALVTDAMAAAGMPDGDFALGELRVAVRGGQARLVTPGGTPGSIAGSTLTMAAAFERMVGWGYSIEQVAAMAATTPARWHGLDAVGELAPGCRADLCVVDDHGQLLRVMQGGSWVVPRADEEVSSHAGRTT